MRLNVKGIKVYRSKGRLYVYHRATGTRIVAPFGTPGFFLEIQALEHQKKVAEPPAATWGGLAAAYRASPKWTKEFSPRTKKDYVEIFEWLAPLNAMPLRDWSREFVIDVRDKAHSVRNWRFANYVVSVISSVFTWSVEKGKLPESKHPARRIRKLKRPKDAGDANRPWTDEEWASVISAAPPHLLPPLLLCGVLGWREGEVLNRPRSDYDSLRRTIRRVSAKSGVTVETPVPDKVATAIEALFPHDALTLVVNSRKRPWTEEGFRASVFKFFGKMRERGLVGAGLTVHGLRHTVATRLREEGYDLDTIKDMLGQKEIGTAEHYARRADLRKKLGAVVSRMRI